MRNYNQEYLISIKKVQELGKELDENSEQVKSLIDDMYLDIAPNLNRKSDMLIFEDTAPTANDFKPDIGSFWLNRDATGGTPELYIMTVKDPSSATWVQIF